MRPRTLLVDDEQDFARLLAARLEAREFPVLTAFDASEGIRAVERESPQVVVLDVNLPDRSGLDVLGEIKERWPLVQVVMLTGQSDVATAVAGMKLGALDYLVKPVDIEPLVAVLERAGERMLTQQESLRMIETGKLAALGRLAEGVAHEISNPVNIMMQKAGWAGELLEDAEADSCLDLGEARSEMEEIVRQGRRCREVVAKLLSLSGRGDPRASLFDPAEAARTVLDQARQRAGTLDVEVVTRFDPGLPQLHLPRGQVEQALTALVDNALDAMAGSGGTLTVSVRSDSPSGVRMEVSDTGPGVRDTLEERIFEPFFSTKEVGQGSGLGLAICHGVMKAMGGGVELVHGGPGATFALTLPTAPSPG